MKPVVKHILSSILFVIILIALLFAASEIIQIKSLVMESNTRDPMSSGYLNEPDNTIDAVILGDSETYSSFIPLKVWNDYGITTYTCGTTGQQLCYSEEYLKRVFYNQSPKVVILETNAVFRDFGYSDVLINTAEKVFPILRYHDRWKLVKPRGASYVEGSRGYYYSKAVSAVPKDKLEKPRNEKDRIPGKNKFYIKNIKEFCDKTDTKLILVSVPNTQNWNKKRHKLLVEMAEELDIELIDMNVLKEDVPINWDKDTRDKGDHLNHSGALKVTAYLGKYLWDTNLFEDKRNDKRYDEWNKSLEKFSNIIS